MMFWKRMGLTTCSGQCCCNRFPDLELRNKRGRRGVRVEVKCLQAVAEEKSANFGYVKEGSQSHYRLYCVVLWDWCRSGRGRLGPCSQDPARLCLSRILAGRTA